MHRRLDDDPANHEFMKSTSLAYGEEQFGHLCKELYQHRTLGSIIARKSTAVFSCKPVTWDGQDDFGHSMGMPLPPSPSKLILLLRSSTTQERPEIQTES